MINRRPDVMSVRPEAVSALREAFMTAVNQVNAALLVLNQQGYLRTPWLGDEVSAQVAAHYTRRAMDDPDSSYAALLAYRDELTRIHDTLQRMEDAYRRGEDAEVARWRPRA